MMVLPFVLGVKKSYLIKTSMNKDIEHTCNKENCDDIYCAYRKQPSTRIFLKSKQTTK